MSDRPREANRLPFERAVRVRCETWRAFAELYTKNLSRGGIFLKTDKPPPPLTAVQINLALPDGRTLAIAGEVAHVVSPERAAAEGGTPGMGVQFTDLDERKRADLEKLVEWVRAQPTPAPLETAVEPAARPAARAAAAPEGAELPTPAIRGATPPQGRRFSVPTPTAALSLEDSSLAATLRACLAELRERDPFDALDVTTEAPEDEIREAAGALAARFAPERFAGRSSEVRAIAAEIAIVIAQASELLLDEGTRAGLIQRRLRRSGPQRRRPPSEQDLFGDMNLDRDQERERRATGAQSMMDDPSVAAPLRATGEWHRAASAMFHAQRYREARDLLRLAMEADPHNLQARRDWHVAYGLEHKVMGDLDAATQELQKALEIDPAHEQATLELRQIAEQRRLRRTALLDRILGKP